MSKLPWYTVGLAAIILISFGFLCKFMLTEGVQLGKDDGFKWDHMIVVFNAIQTLAAAAAGVLLGTTVQQSRVANAEAQASDAKAQATTAQAQAGANQIDANKARAAQNLLNGLKAPGAAPLAPGADPLIHPTVQALKAILI